jgi:NAD(P)-dependent dehydrogenase (short-subunit alcohol dehydrogenase family)
MLAVLIRGTNRGLGFEFVRQYLQDGSEVFAACRNPSGAKELQRLAQKSGGSLTLFAMDVTDAENVRKAAAQLKNGAIDVLINNAGTSGVRGQTTGKVDYGNWVVAVSGVTS